VAVWALAFMTFLVAIEKSPIGATSVTPFGIVFAPPCWLLVYANRGRTTAAGYIAAGVALAGVILGLIMWQTRWSYV
jgi:hypothetical protein